MTDRSWRLLISGGATGAENMALDEAILESCSAGEAPPTLRIYHFDPPCLTLGRFQQPGRDADPEACAARGIDIAIRPTGGRAVLHAGDLVYAVIAPEDDPMVSGGIIESYRRISQALISGLSRLGLPELGAAPRKEPLPRNGACFDLPAAYELTLDGKKLTGSAQVRRGHAVLQHGSILIDDEALRLDGLLRMMGRPIRVGDLNAVTLPQVLGRAVSRDEVAEAVIAGFREHVPGLAEGVLSPSERRRLEAADAAVVPC